jgi:predicted amino acid-binding ACT domain protein
VAYKVTKVAVWSCEIPDRSSGLASVLEPLAEAGAALDCVIARRQPDKPGTGVVYLTPIKGKKVQEAAFNAGLALAAHISTLRVEGPDRAGVGAAMLGAIGQAGVNARGVSAMVNGGKFVAYFGFDSEADAKKAGNAIAAAGKKLGKGRKS